MSGAGAGWKAGGRGEGAAPAAAAFLRCDHFTTKLTTWLQSLSVSVSTW
jgi:hypothetical protein